MRFEEVPAVKRPARKAPPEERTAYREAIKKNNLSRRSVELIRGLRVSLDAAGATIKRLLIVGDGSFCNRTLFRPVLDRTEIIARARRDINLCLRAVAGSRRFYDTVRFTPDQVRLNTRLDWKKVRIFYGGHWRKIKCKEVNEVFWRTGGGKRPLRLFVIEGVPYRSGGRKQRRDPAFLLTTDLIGTPRELLQHYFDRWQIEVNHREEKDTLGVGQAQLRSARSVPRQPAFAVAAYSALMLAGLIAFGPDRNRRYEPLPKWRRSASRPSCLDLITVLRREIIENPDLVKPFHFKILWKSLGLAAAA